MIDPLYRRVLRRFQRPLLALLAVLATGTVGFTVIGEGRASVVDAFYMTFITISTIGYGEIIDMTGHPGARLFTVAIAMAGIGVLTYIFSSATAYIVEGELNAAFKVRRMQKRIVELSDHYIVCGAGRVGHNVAHELVKTERPFVLVDIVGEQVNALIERYPAILHLVGDASEDEVLEKAGIARAAGVFAVTGEDSKNLVIALTAKQLHPAVRVVARCHEVNYFSKMQKVGADAIVSPDFTGGMRIVSSMIRPQVVSFLDEMLRTEDNVRLEEVHLPAAFPGRPVADFAPPSRDYIVLGIKRQGATLFNPDAAAPLQASDTLLVMTTPSGRRALQAKAG